RIIDGRLDRFRHRASCSSVQAREPACARAKRQDEASPGKETSWSDMSQVLVLILPLARAVDRVWASDLVLATALVRGVERRTLLRIARASFNAPDRRGR